MLKRTCFSTRIEARSEHQQVAAEGIAFAALEAAGPGSTFSRRWMVRAAMPVVSLSPAALFENKEILHRNVDRSVSLCLRGTG